MLNKGLIKKIVFGPYLWAGVVVIIAGLWYYTSFKTGTLSPEQKQQALEELLGRKPVLEEKVWPAGEMLYTSKEISFKYPASGIISTSSGVIEVKLPQQKAALIVQISPATNLDEVPAVSIRKNGKKIVVDGQTGLEFISDGEVIVFWIKNGNVISFSLSGGDEIELLKILESVQ